MTRERISVAFPAWNEDAVIERTLMDAADALEKLHVDWEILVVDNASTDSTVSIAEACGREVGRIRILRHPENRGYAASTETAMQKFRGDYLFIIDSDGQHAVADVEPMLARLRDRADVVWGWKQTRREGLVRRIVSRVMNVLCRLLLGSRLHDINCGFRGLSRDAASKIEIRHRVNSVGPEIWVRARNLGLRVEEVPVRHFARDGGESVHAAWRLPGSMARLFGYIWRLRGEIER